MQGKVKCENCGFSATYYTLSEIEIDITIRGFRTFHSMEKADCKGLVISMDGEENAEY